MKPAQRREGLAAVLDIAENALTVAQLATTEMWQVDPKLPVLEARRAMLERNFDAAPVQESPPLRYVAREDLANDGATVDQAAKPIEMSRLVTSALALVDAVTLLRKLPFYFVMERNRLFGIVTRSDLQRPAVSMVTFSISLAAEAGLNPLIERYYGIDWFSHVSTGRQEKIKAIYEDRKRSNVEISKLEAMTFDDRLCLVAKHERLRQKLGFASRGEFTAWKERLSGLRDTLAHGGSFLDAVANPVDAIVLFEQLTAFAETVERVASEVEGPADHARPDH